MTDEEFSRRLQAFMFGRLSPGSTTEESADRQILAEAVLESEDRGIQYGQAVELREHLLNQKHRQELLAALKSIPAPVQEPWWRSLFRLRNLSVMTASAALVVGVVFLVDRFSKESGTSRTADFVPTQIAQTKPPPAVSVLHPSSPSPRLNEDATLSTETPRTAKLLERLFALPDSRITDLDLKLTPAGDYKAEDSIAATFRISEENRVYSLVLGPSGSIRKVFPSLPADAGMLPVGDHTFSFSAGGQMDPGTGGKSRLRLFVTTEDLTGLTNADRWEKLIATSRFQEVTYDVVAP